ncbi:hypothetical protein HPB52_024922 [Rhipicephalus sanguineus]|uniref:Transposase IS30-like HTH domain-containing protein n=1 Tax=Rhipicephalus sanguineus TaxID=34632 RepID=A0A9D4YRV9_RHISA|nr:hypothetical protein HPB52_024922 [Rhipicephalus sanguineus]
MARVPDNERWEIVELYVKGRSQRKIADATGRTLKTVNRTDRGCSAEARGLELRAEQEDAWIIAAAAVKPGLSAQQIKNTLDLRAIRDNGQATPPGSGSEEQDCSPKASSSHSEQRKTAAVFSTACATFK